MGVRRLETYMENNSGCCIPVDIKQLIECYRKETNQKPIILIDILSCFTYFFKYYKVSWIGGGQLKELNEIVNRFFQKFKEFGAEIVVFTDGVCIPSKVQVWVSRRMQEQERIQGLFDQLQMNPFGYSDPNFIFTPRNLQDVMRIAVLKSKCKYIRSIVECDLEIARYAELNHCFAILGQDTDFVIFKGARHYLSMKHFDFAKMTTRAYDRNQLAVSLGLTVEELPFFASLIGNDIVDEGLLKPFHLELQDQRRRYVQRSRFLNMYDNFHNVAQFLKRNRGNLDDILPRVSFAVFKDVLKAELIKESLNSYNVHHSHNDNQIDKSLSDEKWLGVLKLTKERHIANEMVGWVYSIVYFSLFLSGCSLEDYKRNHFPPVLVLCQKLLQKTYGILLWEKPLAKSEKHQVKQLLVSSPESIKGYITVDAIHPTSHSGLNLLWSTDEKLKKERFDLFFWALGIDDSFALMDRHLILPISSLKYLMVTNAQDCSPNAEGLTVYDWELNALVCSVVLLDYYTVEQLTNLPEFPLETRPVNLYALFSRSVSMAIFLNHSCGFPIDVDSENPIRFNDGKLFQEKYREAKSLKSIEQLCKEKKSCIETVMNVIQLLK